MGDLEEKARVNSGEMTVCFLLEIDELKSWVMFYPKLD